MEPCETPATDEPMGPVPSAEQSQEVVSLGAMQSPPTLAPATTAATSASTSGGVPASCVLAGGSSTSPAAMLAASLVRSRATYFERLSSCARASTSSSICCPPLDNGGAAVAAHHQGCPLQPRHSTALASQPLHPLAQHPLAGLPRTGAAAGAAATSGRGREDEQQQLQQQQRRQQQQRHQRQWPRPRRSPQRPDAVVHSCIKEEGEEEEDSDDDDEEDDDEDTFFDKPSYTCYGAAVELSQASSYGASTQCQQQQQQPIHSGGDASAQPGAEATAAQAATQPTGGHCSGALAARPTGSVAAASSGVGCSSGYVRSMSAHFARVSSASSGRGSVAGMDGLFDDLVAHVGALLASHPDVETQMGMVQGLSDRLLQLHDLCEALGRKEDEVEHLRGVLRELTTTRAEAIRLKVQMAESLNGLQREYYKVLRSAQLAQGTCKQHSAKAAATRKQLLEVQSELLRYKRAVASLRDRNRRLRSENEDMAARLHALEGGRVGAEGHRSACYMTLLQAQAPVLY